MFYYAKVLFLTRRIQIFMRKNFCTLILLHTDFAVHLDYPAAPLFFFTLTLLWVIFLRTYPAVPLFYLHLPCCASFFFALTLLCPYFSSRLVTLLWAYF